MRENKTYPGIDNKNRLSSTLNIGLGLVGITLGALSLCAFRPDGALFERINTLLAKGLSGLIHDARSFSINDDGEITIAANVGKKSYEVKIGSGISEEKVQELAKRLRPLDQ